MNAYQVDLETVRYGWNRDHESTLVVPSGSEITIATRDASDGQITRDSSAGSLTRLDFGRVNPISGPIFIEKANPGSTLEIEIVSIDVGPFGWTGQIPGFGLLADEFPDPWLHIWSIDGPMLDFVDGVTIRASPMCGVLGVAPREPGLHPVIPPRRVGGNLDIRQLGPGTKVLLPIEVPGALLGVGDVHAAQGDGEVCGTAVETSGHVTIRLKVRDDLSIEAPVFIGSDPDPGRSWESGYLATTGISSDLREAARDSLRLMIRQLGSLYGLSDADAYGLCSIAADMRISEIVNAPNWVVTAFMARSIFR